MRNRENGLVEWRRVDNLIMIAGRQFLAQRFTGEAVGKPELAIVVGIGESKEQPEDRALEHQVDRVEATILPVSIDNGEGESRVTAAVTATLPATTDGTEQPLHEAGILIRLGQKEVLYNRVTFPVVTRDGNLDLTLTWEVTF
jgi:hypothetical protein